MRLKKSSHLQEIKTNGKAASVEVDATPSCPESLAKIINEDGYTKQQIFSVDKTPLNWEQKPSKSFMGLPWWHA